MQKRKGDDSGGEGECNGYNERGDPSSPMGINTQHTQLGFYGKLGEKKSFLFNCNMQNGTATEKLSRSQSSRQSGKRAGDDRKTRKST